MSLSVEQLQNSTLMNIARGAGGAVQFIQQIAPNSSTWQSSWTSLGFSAGEVVVARNEMGLLSIYATATPSANGREIVHYDQVMGSGIDTKFSGPSSTPLVGGNSWGAARIRDISCVFTVSTSPGHGAGTIEWTSSVAGNNWSKPVTIDVSVQNILPVETGYETISIFGLQADSSVVRIDVDPRNPAETTKHSMPGVFSGYLRDVAMAKGRDPEDNAYFFVCDDNGDIRFTRQEGDETENWRDWSRLGGGERIGGSFYAVSTTNTEDDLMVVLGTTQGAVFANMQTKIEVPNQPVRYDWTGWVKVVNNSDVNITSAAMQGDGTILVMVGQQNDNKSILEARQTAPGKNAWTPVGHEFPGTCSYPVLTNNLFYFS